MQCRWSLIPKTLFLASSMALCCLVPLKSAIAQITPDSTLGAERSVVTPNVNINGLTSDRIDGGALRGVNLFHSFSDFNVGAGRGVYFANPAGIENILTRVTGSNASNIQGTLGVLGNANLFLLNPNGIVFGPNARLDVRDSFLATTASSLVFGNGLEFSATNPQAPPLLTINFPPGLQYRANQPGVITNTGNLAVGQDLTLAAGNLDLQGQLQAGRNLTLLAQDTVKIRDSVASPFIAASGGQLLVQGNQSVDINALSHPASGLFSGGDLVLRSANTIGGDAHFTADGNFQIQKLDGSLGELSSPHDPVILATGDVSLGNYTGASLHILAGGSVDLGNVTLNGTGTTANTISPNSSNSFLAKLANVSLSNGTSVVINGSTQATLDIRAGIDWQALGGLPGNVITGISPAPTLGSTATTAGITIGQINNNYLNSVVLLTNQYSPDSALSGGTITAKGQINAYSGSVTIDARDNLTVAGGINTSYSAGNGGNITLLSTGGGIDTSAGTLNSGSGVGNGGAISLTARNNIKTSNLYANSFGAGNGGNITLLSTGGSIDTSAGLLQSTSKNGNGRAITLTAQNNITTGELDSFTNGNGNGGNITLLSTGGGIDTSAGTLNSSSGAGNGGEINLSAQNNITTGNLYSYSNSAGNGGNITLLSTGGGIDTSAGTLNSGYGAGNGGEIALSAQNNITTGNLYSYSNSAGNGGNITLLSTGGGIDTSAGTLNSGYGAGNGGEIALSAQNNITTGNLYSYSDGTKGGVVTIDSRGKFTLNGIVDTSAIANAAGTYFGNGGDVTVLAQGDISLNSGASIVASGLLGGNITLVSGGAISATSGLIGSSSYTTQQGVKGGDVNVIANSLSLNEAALITGTYGGADAGNVNIKALDAVTFNGVGGGAVSLVNQGATGNGGNINITTGSLSVTGGALLGASTSGLGNAGSININARDTVTFDGMGISPNTGNIAYSSAETGAGAGAEGKGGDITISARSLFLSNGAYLTTSPLGGLTNAGNILVNATDSISINSGAMIFSSNFGQGNGGDITLRAGEKVALSGDSSEIVTSQFGGISGIVNNGNSGNINIQTGSLFLSNGAQIQSGIRAGGGDSGNILVNATHSIFINNGAYIGTANAGQGNGGNVTLLAGNKVSLMNDSIVGTNGEGNGNSGNINVQTGSLSVSNRSGLTSAIYGRGSDGGNITILASGAVSFDGVDTAGTGVSSTAEPGAIGNAGDIKLTAQSLSLTNGAFLVSNSQGGGAAGSIEVTTTKDIHLDNGASIASNTTGGQGNITLSSRDLFLRHNSDITTNATGPATGGNITIYTGNLVAVPLENSDISANAEDSFGGRISITAAGIFGTQYRPHLTPLSDITATSNLGPQFNGTVQLNILSPDPTRGLAELPQNVVDPASQIANNPCTKGKSSEFTITGRGGLPPNPHEVLNSDAVSVGLVDATSSHQGRGRKDDPVPTPKTTIQEPIVPAQGWVFNNKGQVVLTAYNPAVTQPQRPWRNPGACHAL